MSKKFIILSFIILIFSPVLLTQSAAQTTTPVPEGYISIPGIPDYGNLKGSSVGNNLSFDSGFDLTNLPQNINVTSATLFFSQNMSGSGLLKIIDKASGTAITSYNISQSGVHQTSEILSKVNAVQNTSSSNISLLFQSYELGTKDNINFSQINLEIKYIFKDILAPELLTQEILDLQDTSVIIKWTANEETKGFVEFGKTIKYGQNSSYTPLPALENSLQLSSLTPGITYHYRIHLEDMVGNKLISPDYTFQTTYNQLTSSDNNSSSNNGLSQPVNFEAKLALVGGKYQVDLIWKYLTLHDIDGFILYKRIDKSSDDKLAVLDATHTSYTDPNVEKNQRYTYYVKAYKANILSTASEETTIVVSADGKVLGADTETERITNISSILVVLGVLSLWLFMIYLVFKRMQKALLTRKGLVNILRSPEYYQNDFEKNIISNQD
ncbi:MAG: fibronectin type III domain-containing protein [bacterium]